MKTGKQQEALIAVNSSFASNFFLNLYNQEFHLLGPNIPGIFGGSPSHRTSKFHNMFQLNLLCRVS